MKLEIIIIICFFVGALIYLLINSYCSCSCKVVEGQNVGDIVYYKGQKFRVFPLIQDQRDWDGRSAAEIGYINITPIITDPNTGEETEIIPDIEELNLSARVGLNAHFTRGAIRSPLLNVPREEVITEEEFQITMDPTCTTGIQTQQPGADNCMLNRVLLPATIDSNRGIENILMTERGRRPRLNGIITAVLEVTPQFDARAVFVNQLPSPERIFTLINRRLTPVQNTINPIMQNREIIGYTTTLLVEWTPSVIDNADGLTYNIGLMERQVGNMQDNNNAATVQGQRSETSVRLLTNRIGVPIGDFRITISYDQQGDIVFLPDYGYLNGVTTRVNDQYRIPIQDIFQSDIPFGRYYRVTYLPEATGIFGRPSIFQRIRGRQPQSIWFHESYIRYSTMILLRLIQFRTEHIHNLTRQQIYQYMRGARRGREWDALFEIGLQTLISERRNILNPTQDITNGQIAGAAEALDEPRRVIFGGVEVREYTPDPPAPTPPVTPTPPVLPSAPVDLAPFPGFSPRPVLPSAPPLSELPGQPSAPPPLSEIEERIQRYAARRMGYIGTGDIVMLNPSGIIALRNTIGELIRDRVHQGIRDMDVNSNGNLMIGGNIRYNLRGNLIDRILDFFGGDRREVGIANPNSPAAIRLPEWGNPRGANNYFVIERLPIAGPTPIFRLRYGLDRTRLDTTTLIGIIQVIERIRWTANHFIFYGGPGTPPLITDYDVQQPQPQPEPEAEMFPLSPADTQLVFGHVVPPGLLAIIEDPNERDNINSNNNNNNDQDELYVIIEDPNETDNINNNSGGGNDPGGGGGALEMEPEPEGSTEPSSDEIWAEIVLGLTENIGFSDAAVLAGFCGSFFRTGGSGGSGFRRL